MSWSSTAAFQEIEARTASRDGECQDDPVHRGHVRYERFWKFRKVTRRDGLSGSSFPPIWKSSSTVDGAIGRPRHLGHAPALQNPNPTSASSPIAVWSAIWPNVTISS